METVLGVASNMRVLMVTSEWPTPAQPDAVPFVVQQVEFLRRAGVDLDVFHFRGLGNPVNYLRSWLAIRRKLSANCYDLIHAQWGQSGLLALPKKLPLVVTFRGSDLQGIVAKSGRYTLSGKVLQALSRIVAKFADEVIVVSRRLASHIPGVACHVIPSGVDLNLFRPIPRREARERLGLSQNVKIILFAASPDRPEKRFELAREAVSLLGLNGGVELVFAKGVPRELMPNYLNSCDLLLLTSLHEGSPNVIKEALACNTPVVTVDVGDARERLGSVEGCIVCDDDRPFTIAAALASVLAREERINGAQAVAALDERIVGLQLISIYQDVVQRSHRPAGGYTRGE